MGIVSKCNFKSLPWWLWKGQGHGQGPSDQPRGDMRRRGAWGAMRRRGAWGAMRGPCGAMRERGPWPGGSRTNPGCRAGCSRRRSESAGCLGRARSWSCRPQGSASCCGPLGATEKHMLHGETITNRPRIKSLRVRLYRPESPHTETWFVGCAFLWPTRQICIPWHVGLHGIPLTEGMSVCCCTNLLYSRKNEFNHLVWIHL